MADLDTIASRLMFIPTTSTRHMWHEERRDVIRQMLADLERLAVEDGCLAAAWALEFVSECPTSVEHAANPLEVGKPDRT